MRRSSFQAPAYSFDYPLPSPTQLLMLADPFTTQDGDVLLRAGSDTGLKHDFRVHKVVLLLASRVFKDLFQTAQPDGGQEDPLPVISVTDSPETIDLLLRFIYPGLVPPTTTDLVTLATLLTIADKYDIPTISPIVKGRLADEKVLKSDPFGVYIIARRWGFSDEAKRAAREITLAKINKSPFSGDPQNFVKEDFLRLLWFMQKRGDEAKKQIRTLSDEWVSDGDQEFYVCGDHCGYESREFFKALAERIIQGFDINPSLGRWEMAMALSTTRDPPHTGFCDDEEPQPPFTIYCPLRPANIVRRLDILAHNLEDICVRYLNRAMDGSFPI